MLQSMLRSHSELKSTATEHAMQEQQKKIPRNVVSFLSRLLPTPLLQSMAVGSPATATEHGCRLITTVSLHRNFPLAPLLQSMAVNYFPRLLLCEIHACQIPTK